VELKLNRDETKDLTDYCKLNNLNVEDIIKKCFKEGFNIERYGLLSGSNKSKEIIKEVIVEKPIEIIKEVPVEVLREIEVIKEIPVEVIKEVPVEIIKEIQLPPIEVEVIKYVDKEIIKEVVIEKPVTNFDNFYDKTYVESLENKIKELETNQPEVREVITEVIKEVPIEIIKEVPVEITKEIIIEKEDVNLKIKFESLQQTLMKLREENLEKDKKLREFEALINDIEDMKTKQAAFLKGSNLNNKLY